MDKASIIEQSLQRSTDIYNTQKKILASKETNCSENQGQWKKNKSTKDTRTEMVHEKNFPNSQDNGCAKCGKNHSGECRA